MAVGVCEWRVSGAYGCASRGLRVCDTRFGQMARRKPPRRSELPLLRATTLRAFILIPLAACVLGACSQGGRAPDPQLGVTSSPRVVAGRAVPKGGGIYKVGNPYKVAGRWYVPREVDALRPDRDCFLVRGRLPWPAHGQRRDLRHVRLDGGASDLAAAVLRLRHQPGQRPHHPGADQRPRSLRQQSFDRPVVALGARAGVQPPGSGARARALRRTGTPQRQRCGRASPLAAQPWYQGNLNVAQISGSDISTGAIGTVRRRPPGRWPSTGSNGMTGPETRAPPHSAGRRESTAEGRSRHSPRRSGCATSWKLGPVVVEQVGSGAEARFGCASVPRRRAWRQRSKWRARPVDGFVQQ